MQTAMNRSYWLNRFSVVQEGANHLRFKDRLRPDHRTLPLRLFTGFEGRRQEIELLRLGFIDPVMPAVLRPLADAPREAEDTLFWQFPCRTEADAWLIHTRLEEAPYDGHDVHVYLGLPWATWIDHQRNDSALSQAKQEMRLQRVRLSGIRHALADAGAALRVHTVCQHVYWRDFLPLWQEMGVTDLWLSHAPPRRERSYGGMKLHPWRLFAVNVEDSARNAGLRAGVDPASKALLASFVGAHADHYITMVRQQLLTLAGEPGFHIELTNKWHFEDVVYRHQVHHAPLQESYRIDDAVESYNRVLSDSVFSLCPAGAGPNTLRLWESLAVGAVPVLIGPAPEMPCGGTLENIDWDGIVLRVTEKEVENLPMKLRSMRLEEVRMRQQRGMQAYAAVRQQRCFK